MRVYLPGVALVLGGYAYADVLKLFLRTTPGARDST